MMGLFVLNWSPRFNGEQPLTGFNIHQLIEVLIEQTSCNPLTMA